MDVDHMHLDKSSMGENKVKDIALAIVVYWIFSPTLSSLNL